MGTRMKRIIFIMIFGMFLLIVGSVFALTSLSDTSKVEKIGDTYSVYVLKEQKTGIEIQDELSSLNEEKKSYSTEIYPSCVQGCPYWCIFEAEYLNLTEVVKGCAENCPVMCELERDYLIEITDKRINELNVILKSK